ncbi:bifunctional pyr operon transcriptional regulator/uracil phosphoribosyltransferase PyrR [soil metagenome]
MAEKTKAKKKPAASEALMSGAEIAKALKRIAGDIAKEFPQPEKLLILGIRTRGVVLAERLIALLEKSYGAEVAGGVLDITFYRDDLSQLGPHPMVRGSELPFDIHDARIVLVDDVLYTGRTVRAAMDEISDFGRPALIRLAILVDRGLREYPIQPDYCGLRIETKQNQVVHVMLEETDSEEQVLLEERKAT